MFAILLSVTALAVAFFFAIPRVVRDGRRGEGRWGIQRAEVACPECATSLPPRRVPRNLHQALWGGWICHACRCAVDKWGKVARS